MLVCLLCEASGAKGVVVCFITLSVFGFSCCCLREGESVCRGMKERKVVFRTIDIVQLKRGHLNGMGQDRMEDDCHSLPRHVRPSRVWVGSSSMGEVIYF